MSDFAVRVLPVRNVRHHPDADRLSIMDVLGYVTISAKLDDGSHRYNDGDLVIYVPEGAVLPEWLLKQGFWNEEKQKGTLAGSKGDRVKAMRLRGVLSQGIIFPVENGFIKNEVGEVLEVKDGDNVAEFLGITKYEPPVPVGMAGEVCAIFGKTARYDFESIQTLPDLFAVGEEVVVTEKVHGTCIQIGYVPGLDNSDLFFDGNLYVGSKGLSAKGLVFKNNEANVNNVYVRVLKGLLETGFGEMITIISKEYGDAPVRVFGEVYGKGIQDLSYGADKPTLAIFDIQIDGQYVKFEALLALAKRLGLAVVPTLYEGPFDLDVLVNHRDGKDTLSNTNVREGIVIKARDNSLHPNHGRKIGKWVSPDYLTRKGNVTEFQ